MPGSVNRRGGRLRQPSRPEYRLRRLWSPPPSGPAVRGPIGRAIRARPATSAPPGFLGGARRVSRGKKSGGSSRRAGTPDSCCRSRGSDPVNGFDLTGTRIGARIKPKTGFHPAHPCTRSAPRTDLTSTCLLPGHRETLWVLGRLRIQSAESAHRAANLGGGISPYHRQRIRRPGSARLMSNSSARAYDTLKHPCGCPPSLIIDNFHSRRSLRRALNSVIRCSTITYRQWPRGQTEFGLEAERSLAS